MYKIRPRRPLRRVVESLLIATLAISGIVVAVGIAKTLKYSTFTYGPNTSVFSPGEGILIERDVEVGGVGLSAGTPGVVVDDPPDEDSAYPDRLVRVKITAGRYQGTIHGVERRHLRAYSLF